jgi:hypothetical protein
VKYQNSGDKTEELKIFQGTKIKLNQTQNKEMRMLLDISTAALTRRSQSSVFRFWKGMIFNLEFIPNQ